MNEGKTEKNKSSGVQTAWRKEQDRCEGRTNLGIGSERGIERRSRM